MTFSPHSLPAQHPLLSGPGRNCIIAGILVVGCPAPTQLLFLPCVGHVLGAQQLLGHSKSIHVLTYPNDLNGLSEETEAFDKQKELNYFWRGEEMTPPADWISPFGLDWRAHHGRPPGRHPPSLMPSRRGAGPVFGEPDRGRRRWLFGDHTGHEEIHHSNSDT